MQTLTIKKLKQADNSQFEKILEEQCELFSVEQINWAGFPYRPEVKFRIAHLGDQILLKFYVREKNIGAKTSTANGDVYKDSCVEFFISPQGDGNYYNFEFNCIGTPHVGYGDGRHNRLPLPVETLKTIIARSSLGSEPFAERHGDFTWELFVQIPVACFIHDKIEKLDGLSSSGNFYKCGDELAEPHFVTWNPIKTENPDYHRPEFFGKIGFE
ncbi:MAG: hypothetical protein A2W90_04470 [Bacteroidetes bacterium GWF2_42_66]|nr:MAG: hypothetical protein A2W92_11315 [Bacteroidetes bacterium GWA2_42_15]OFY00819.1 MAG: hypothetical protein A2W89_20690 [Bacteroidetes bacterium GWE2_42_39]OFY40845.1 MAG: hypothetical protein A2W90_04470 [Bacteroidetes bacterium GWF2_42_66]HBL75760.1 hypothetical protein [Prolixibacteraceae bacterium]HCR89601.1 hypothetical protein [Prolixibacteraceae bacterium]